MAIRIYHNPRCAKSRQTLALLQEAGITPQIVLYLDTPPSAGELAKLVKALGFSSARQLLRKSEEVYKALNLANVELTEAELINTMVTNPILIERPIVVKGTQAVLGRPPENVQKLL